jgi:hypothetical protein
MAREDEVMIEGAKIIWRNFEGREGMYNAKGDRNFAVVLDDETAKQLERTGWNVKRKPPREEGEEELIVLSVAVSYKGRPPRIVLIGRKFDHRLQEERLIRTPLDEELCGLVDSVEFDNVDIILNPYDWKLKSGQSGRKAYLKTFFGLVHQDPLEAKYAHIPEEEQFALTAGDDPDILDGDVVDEYEDAEGEILHMRAIEG